MGISRSTLLDLATAGLVVAALAALVHDRVLPALEERDRLDPGERVGGGAPFRSIATGDSVELREEGASILLVFRSSCPVCEETAPAWAGLAEAAPARFLAIGLESDSAAGAWVADRLPDVEAVAPFDPAGFIDHLRIRAVPTTLLFDDGRLVFSRIGALRTDDQARIRRALHGTGADAPTRAQFSR